MSKRSPLATDGRELSMVQVAELLALCFTASQLRSAQDFLGNYSLARDTSGFAQQTFRDYWALLDTARHGNVSCETRESIDRATKMEERHAYRQPTGWAYVETATECAPYVAPRDTRDTATIAREQAEISALIEATRAAKSVRK